MSHALSPFLPNHLTRLPIALLLQGKVSLFDLRQRTPTECPPTTAVDLSDVGGCTALVFDPTSSGNHFAVGCDDPIVRTYDIRSLGRTDDPSAVDPVFQYAPRELLPPIGRRRHRTYRRMASGASGLAYSSTGQLVVNMRGADVYLFAGMRDVLASSAPLRVASHAASLPSTPADAASVDDGACSASARAAVSLPSASTALAPAASSAAAAAAASSANPSSKGCEEGCEEGEAEASGEAGASGSSAGAAPMDAEVAAFETRTASASARDASSSSGLDAEVAAMYDGVPTLTQVLTHFTGRANEDTFAKEVCFLHDGAYVATGGDCGHVYVWGAQSGRLVYRARGDSSIVNVVAPHPSLPMLAVSGIDDNVKLFGLGEIQPSRLRRRTIRSACEGRVMTSTIGTTDEDAEGWAKDDDGPPPPSVSATQAQERLTLAAELRERGNNAFNDGDVPHAAATYEAALEAVHMTPPTPALDSDVENERCRLCLNLALSSLKLMQPAAAVAWCAEVLVVRPEDITALYRRALAHLKLGMTDRASEGLRRAMAIDPSEPSLLRLQSALRRARRREEGMHIFVGNEDEDEEDDDDDGDEDEDEEDEDEVGEDGDDDEEEEDDDEENGETDEESESDDDEGSAEEAESADAGGEEEDDEGGEAEESRDDDVELGESAETTGRAGELGREREPAAEAGRLGSTRAVEWARVAASLPSAQGASSGASFAFDFVAEDGASTSHEASASAEGQAVPEAPA